jgi:hypothetical protein
MTGADKRRNDFKTNPAAKTTASDNFLHFQTVKRNRFAGDVLIVNGPCGRWPGTDATAKIVTATLRLKITNAWSHDCIETPNAARSWR